MADKHRTVDAQTAARLVASGVHVIDIRPEGEWAAGRVEGSDRIPAGAVDSHRVGRADSVLTVCRNGIKSKRAAKKLAKQGYKVYHLEGGMLAWHAAGYPLVSSNGARATVA